MKNRLHAILTLSGWTTAALLWFTATEHKAKGYEGSPGATAAVASSHCSGDSNGSGTVDVTDLLLLLSAWGTCPDGDGDGFTLADGDCNDDDSSIYPGAPELCDGKDNDCNGLSDEIFPTLGQICIVGLGVCESIGYIQCSADQSGVECSVTAGIPGFEVCNGLDDDCNGIIDDMPPDILIWYLDADFDGVGNTDTDISSCFQPSYVWVLLNGDCDDSDPNVFPGAVEICNGIDDNCDGVIDEGCP